MGGKGIKMKKKKKTHQDLKILCHLLLQEIKVFVRPMLVLLTGCKTDTEDSSTIDANSRSSKDGKAVKHLVQNIMNLTTSNIIREVALIHSVKIALIYSLIL